MHTTSNYIYLFTLFEFSIVNFYRKKTRSISTELGVRRHRNICKRSLRRIHTIDLWLLTFVMGRYIGCSDSRVPANQILGLGPGEVFVHRNVGNQVIGSDMNCLSVIEFAVKHLNVKHIIVAGHYDCGAVHASMKKQDLGLLENWIRSIRDVYRIHQQSMSLIEEPEQRHRRMVELNVIEQCLNLYKTGAVQEKRMECIKRGDKLAYPRVHAMVFDPKVGLLKKLPINFRKVISQFKDIYDMY